MYGLTTVQSKTRFIVFNEYEIGNDEIKPTKNAIDDFYKKNDYKYSYQPLEDAPELYAELAKLELSDTKGVLKFIQNYGLPVESGEVGFVDHQNLIFTCTNLNDFSEELKLYKTLFKAWASIQSGNKNELLEIRDKYYKMVNMLSIFNMTSHADRVLSQENGEFIDVSFTAKGKDHSLAEENKRMNQDDLQAIAKKYVVYLLNQVPAGKNQFEIINNEIRPSIHFSNLFEAAYYQLSKAMVNNTELKRCEFCKSLFQPEHGHQKFCSPRLPNQSKSKHKKRSSCENAHNQKLKRQRRKQTENKRFNA